LIVAKYNLLRNVRQASRERCALRTNKALHFASIAQKIKEIFEEEVSPDMLTKESAKKFRKDWKHSLEKYTSNGFGYMNRLLRDQCKKDSIISSAEEEIHGTCQAL